MNRTFLTILLGSMLSSFALGNAAFAHSVSNAKAAELALHRVERLVILKKIEDTFQTRVESLKLTLLAHQDENEPSFQATLTQFVASDNTRKSVDVIMNEEGKSLSYKVATGGDAATYPKWPSKDAVTLAESSLHYVQDNAPMNTDIAAFETGMTSLTISEGTDAQGAMVAVIQIETTPTDPYLKITLMTDGMVQKAEVIKRSP